MGFVNACQRGEKLPALAAGIWQTARRQAMDTGKKLVWPYFGATMDEAFFAEKDFIFPDKAQTLSNPWMGRFRPRCTLAPFRVPWAPPKPYGHKVPGQPAYLEEYRRACKITKPSAYRYRLPPFALWLPL